MRGIQFGVGLLLLIVAVNVAILVYARTATRMGEIAVRTALGASRGRVVSQLFVEALVPSVAAAAIGLAIMHVALKMIRAAIEQEEDGASVLPFLIDFKLSPAVIFYVTLLAVLAAVIAGVLPALKATGKRVQQGLQQFSARAAGVQLGPTWTALIVLQVAVAVAVLPAALYHGMNFFRRAAAAPRRGRARAGPRVARVVPRRTRARARQAARRIHDRVDPTARGRPRDRRGHVRGPVSRPGELRADSSSRVPAARRRQRPRRASRFRRGPTWWRSISSTCSRSRSWPAADSPRATCALIQPW